MKNKIYVITGATSGIGEALVKILAKESLVYAGYRTEEKKEELCKISSNIVPFYVDYAKPETVSGAIDFIKKETDRVDTLINIAGCVVAGPVEKLEIKDIRRQFDVNVFGHVELAQGIANIMDNGRIINISSMASYGLFPFISPYCASKRCLDMFFNSFLLENKRNIKVISIKPGVIATPLWGKSIRENTESMVNCDGYEKEMAYVAKNAHKNESRGLSVDKVVEVILKADSAKNPKLSYNVGKDSFFAHLVSKLPQRMINSIVKLGMKTRMSRK